MSHNSQPSNNPVNSQPTNDLVVLSDDLSKLSHDAQLVQLQMTVNAVTIIFQSTIEVVKIVADGHQYRNNLQEEVKTLETKQTMRHKNADKKLNVLREFGPNMSQETSDQYYLSILDDLKGTELIAEARLISPEKNRSPIVKS